MDKANVRYNILISIVYIVGIMLLVNLFNLQIIHGEEFREQSNTRLTRETTLHAARGNIIDVTGNVIAGTKMGFVLDMYRTNIDEETLNNTILRVINILEKNNDTYVNNFPIKVNPYEFKTDDLEYIKEWKEMYGIEEQNSAEECFNYFKKEYKITR